MNYFSFLLLFTTLIFGQVNHPKDYFGLPLDIPMSLSGNFGELRPNHFHAGFDLKTAGREGLEIHAVGDGFVSRIKVSPFGNGTAIYIDHPNGYTTVYCHLQKFVGEIAEKVKKAQYEKNSFEVELFFKPGELLVKKAQTIALSGNTGSSGGPHLHFEFRETKTEKIINPLFFGYDQFLKDANPPTISAVYVYPLEHSSANHSKQPTLLSLSLQKDGTYLATKVLANGKIGFGVTADDYDTTSGSKNGVYKMQSFLNGTPSFGFQMDTYSFDDMRYINAMIDYPKYLKTSLRVQKMFMNQPFALSLLKTDATNGVLTVLPNMDYVYRLEISDFFGNMKTVVIPIGFDNQTPIIENETIEADYFIKVNRDSNFEKNNWSVFFPAGTFYENFKFNFDVKNDTLYLHNTNTPVHSNFTIIAQDLKYKEEERDKVYIADINSRGRLGYNYTTRKGAVFTAKVKSLGKYTLAKDTTKPVVTIAKSIEGKWINAQQQLDLYISDSQSGIKTYNGYLNGVWALFEYDYKTKKITHHFDQGIVAEGANDLKIIVTDNVGNATTFETRFFRSQK
ncbi:MAG: hypothetical protein QG594_63 [Bacteroidota bacterium]|nr:hypothetical protein [Bacteroidota bacterium]